MTMTDSSTTPTPIQCDQMHVIDGIITSFLIDPYVENGNINGYFENFQVFGELTTTLRNRGYSFSIRDSAVKKKEDKNTMIFYHLNAMPINFFGLPFTVEKTLYYQCVHGRKYYKTKAEKLSNDHHGVKKRTITSKKLGCVATMTLKKILFYPKYYLDDPKKWRKKKLLIENLRTALRDQEAVVEQSVRYYISISMKDRHNHPPLYDFVTGTSPITENLLSGKTSIGQGEVSNGSEHEQDAQLLLNNDAIAWEKPASPPTTVAESDTQKDSSNIISYQITTQYSSIQDLHTLFKEKLKRLYILGENCENSSLLVKLVSEFEQADLELVADIGYDPTSII